MAFKIQSLEVTNFKSITSTKIDIAGQSFAIIGKNGEGKSSLIQAMQAAFDTTIVPKEPVKKGEERANIKVSLSNEEDKVYVISMSFSETNKTGTVIIKNENGEKVSDTKSWIKKMFKAKSFDITKFLNESPAKQVDLIKELCDKTVLKKLDELTYERERLFDQRTFDKRFLKEQDAKIKNHGYSDEEIKKYKKPLPEDEVRTKMEKVQDDILKYERVVSGLETRESSKADAAKSIHDARVEINRIEEEARRKVENLRSEVLRKEAWVEELENEIKEGKAWLSKNRKPELPEIQEELSEIQRHNLEHERITKYRDELKALADKRQEILDADKRIESIDKEKVTLFDSAGIPIEGLSFDDTGVLYNGLPLNENQIERSRLMKISAEIGMALNKELKTIFLQDASLLDADSMDYLKSLCEENGYQLIIELVGDNEEVDVKFFEEKI